MAGSELLLDVKDYVATITINRPDKRNAFTGPMTVQMAQMLEELKDRDDVHVVIVRGAGDQAFSAGHDLKEVAERHRRHDYGEPMEIFELCRLLTTLPKPTIAAVRGFVRAGANWLMASCDIVIASEDATFATPQINFGTFPTLPYVSIARRMGRSKAVDMLLTADLIDAKEAKAIGYVDRLVPAEQFESALQELAQKIASRDPQAVRAGKEALMLLTDADFIRDLRTMVNANLLQAMTREAEDAAKLTEAHLRTVRGTGEKQLRERRYELPRV